MRARALTTLLTIALSSTGLVVAVIPAPVTAQQQAAEEGLTDRDHDRGHHAAALAVAPLPGARVGQDAIEELGADLASVAADHDLSHAELVETLQEDPALQIDADGRLLYADPEIPAAAASAADVDRLAQAGPFDGPAGDGLFDLTETFELHSNPGADRVIFLDFDGHMIENSVWVAGQDPYYAGPYSIDGSPGFTDIELGRIQYMWRLVAEDFAPFDVDVTTEDPGFAAINRSSFADQRYGTRALITSTDNRECICGGVAYVDIFDFVGVGGVRNHAFYQPAFAYSHGAGTNPKTLAEAASHEVGHNLGLGHDGIGVGGYYEGHEPWAPIMGSGYNQPVTHWSRGDYDNASNDQDDLSVMQRNGVAARPDDHGDTAGAATNLPAGPAISATGLIGLGGDIDVFRLTAGGGELTIDAEPSGFAPNLDIRLELRDRAGDLVASADPAVARTSHHSAGGLSAILQTTVQAGTYTLSVRGTGFGGASDGYTSYGSMGPYDLSGSVPQDESDPTPTPTPTPDPTLTPTPDPEPTPDPTPTPDPETTPDPTPTPDPNPEPTPDPEPTPRPTPSPTPRPPSPSPSPQPTGGQDPEQPLTPHPTTSPDPTPQPPATQEPGEPAGPVSVVLRDEATANSELAVSVSQATYPDEGALAVVGAEVLLASEAVFADALASGALQTDGVLLLNDPVVLEPSVLTEIQRLGVTTVRILGGEAAISVTVEDALVNAGLNVERTFGPTRLETAAAIAALRSTDPSSREVSPEEEVPRPGFLSRAFPAAGATDPTQAFADSLALGGWAASVGGSVLLTQTEVLSTTTGGYLAGAEIDDLTVVGGEFAIQGSVAAEAEASVGTVRRVSGANRFATATSIASARGFGPDNPAQSIIVIEGQAPNSWAAGFSLAALAARTNAPIVMINGDLVPEDTATFLSTSVAADARFTCVGSSVACDEAQALVEG